MDSSDQGFTNSRRQITVATKFCVVLSNIFGSPLRKMFHFTLLYLEIWGGSQVFGKNFWAAGLDARVEVLSVAWQFHLSLYSGLWRRRFWQVLPLFRRTILLPSSGWIKRKATCFSEIVLSIYHKLWCHESVLENWLNKQ